MRLLLANKVVRVSRLSKVEAKIITMPDDSPERSRLAQYAALSQVGLEMVAPIGIGALIDLWRDWGPWCSTAGAILGLVGGVAHLIQILNARTSGESAKQRREQR
jgi:F0F1-type ATP synthase assembly protein I